MRCFGFRIQVNAVLGHKLEIRPAVHHGKDEIIFQRHFTFGCVENDVPRPDFFDARIEIGFHFAVLDPVLDVGLDPEYFTLFDIPRPRCTIVTRAPVQNNSRAAIGLSLCVHHQHVVIVVGVGFLVVVNYFRKTPRQAHAGGSECRNIRWPG